MPTLTVYLLGPPRFEINSESVKFPTAKTLALAAYAAFNSGKHSREALAAMFWPEYEPKKAHAALRTTLWRVKDALGEWAITRRADFEIPVDAGVWVDARHMNSLVELCRTDKHSGSGYYSLDYPHSHSRGRISCSNCLPLLDEAVSLYRSDFMEGFSLRDSPLFDHWQSITAEQIHSNMVDCLDRLVAAYAGQNRLEDAIHCARRWLSLSPLNEEALRQLMWLLYLTGDRSGSIHLFQEFEASQVKMEGIELEEVTIYLLHTLQEKTTPRSLHSNSGANRLSKPAPLINVPAMLTPFVGRKSELKSIQDLLSDPSCRFLTLVGTGGIGKTRLALQAAVQFSEEDQAPRLFADGICFVPLDTVTEAERVPDAIASALGYTFYGKEQPLAQLARYLRQKSFLIILDNLEHLPKSYEMMIELLGAAPHLKILATSRLRMNVRGEWTLTVEGLDYPIGHGAEAIESYSAVRLFLDCARRADPSFILWKEEAAQLIRICSLLDGLPLGLEMAAPLICSLTLKEIASDIEQSLDFLISNQQDIPERQNSLRAVFDYSWKNLTPVEKDILMRMSVYLGGFSREQASSATGISPRTLADLVGKSILRRTTPNRYEMLPLFQLYVQGRLAESPDKMRQAKDEHSVYFAAFMVDRYRWLSSAQQAQAVEEIQMELDNIRSAWSWAVDQKNLQLLESILFPLACTVTIKGWFQEAVRMLDLALNVIPYENILPAEMSPKAAHLVSYILYYKARCIHRLGSLQEAKCYYDRSMEIATTFNDTVLIAYNLQGLGNTAAAEGYYEKARRLQTKGLEIIQTTKDQWGLGNSYVALGVVCAEPQESQRLYREALRIFRQLGDSWAAANCLTNLADADMQLGDYVEARLLSLETLKVYERLGSHYTIAIALANVAQSSEMLEEYEMAQEYYERALEYYREVGNISDTTIIEVMLSGVELHTRDSDKGWSRILQALETIRTNPNRPLVLDIITTLSEYVFTEQPELCAEMLTCVKHHPAAWGRTRKKAVDLLSVVKSCLPELTYKSAVERGCSLDPLEAAAQLLEKFSS